MQIFIRSFLSIIFAAGLAVWLTGCAGKSSSRPESGPDRIKGEGYEPALHYLRQGLEAFSLARDGKTVAVNIRLAESFLDIFWDDNPGLKKTYGELGIRFLRDELREDEKILFDQYYAWLDSKKEGDAEQSTGDTPESGEAGREGGMEEEQEQEEGQDVKEIPVREVRELLEGAMADFEMRFPRAVAGIHLVDSGVVSPDSSNPDTGIADNDDPDIHTELFAHNVGKCFIPASLTKLVLEGALIETLRENTDSGQLDESLKRLSNGTYFSLADLFLSLNSYTFSTAQQANRTAVSLGELLTGVWGGGYDLNDIGSGFISNHSEMEPCTRIIHPAGLSIYNFLTPRQVSDILVYLRDETDFTQSLLRPGKGTMKDRLKDLNAGTGVFHAFKTGSLRKNGVLCLAGYLFNRRFSMVMMINNLAPERSAAAREWMDDAIVALCTLLEGKK